MTLFASESGIDSTPKARTHSFYCKRLAEIVWVPCNCFPRASHQSALIHSSTKLCQRRDWSPSLRTWDLELRRGLRRMRTNFGSPFPGHKKKPPCSWSMANGVARWVQHPPPTSSSPPSVSRLDDSSTFACPLKTSGCATKLCKNWVCLQRAARWRIGENIGSWWWSVLTGVGNQRVGLSDYPKRTFVRSKGSPATKNMNKKADPVSRPAWQCFKEESRFMKMDDIFCAPICYFGF